MFSTCSERKRTWSESQEWTKILMVRTQYMDCHTVADLHFHLPQSCQGSVSLVSISSQHWFNYCVKFQYRKLPKTCFYLSVILLVPYCWIIMSEAYEATTFPACHSQTATTGICVETASRGHPLGPSWALTMCLKQTSVLPSTGCCCCGLEGYFQRWRHSVHDSSSPYRIKLLSKYPSTKCLEQGG